MRLTILGVLLWTLPLFAGQSIRLTGVDAQYSASLDNIANTSDIRVEGYVHDVHSAGANKSLVSLSGVGWQVFYSEPNGLFFTFQRDAGGIECIVPYTRTAFLFRLQRLYNGGSPIHQCEIWDVDGGNYTVKTSSTPTIQSWPNTGGHLFGNGDTRFAFLRVFTSTVALGGKPPATADNAGAWAAWKFDGNANDSSGNGRNLNDGGSSYYTSPDPIVVTIAKTTSTPYWATFRPLRAGHPDQLDGEASYSMSDNSSAVSCFWQQLSGPSTAVFDDRTSCTPTLTGLVFGAYRFRLRGRDVDGRESVVDADIGAVAYDSNGVVIYPDARLYTLIGPQVVRGQNPWEYADERQTVLTLERANLWKPGGGSQFIRALETDLNGTPLEGTVYWSDTTQAKTMYGIGTNFLDVFCGGAAGPANNADIIPRRSTPVFGESENGLPRGLIHRVKSCVSDTEISVLTYYESEQSLTTASPGVPWAVGNIGGQYPSLRVGTVYIANGSNTLYGTGTSFRSLWCNGGGTPISGASVMLPDSPLMSSWGISACVSDTQATLTANFTGATISAPGGAWIPVKPEPDRGYMSIAANMNAVYYDTPLAFYREWYRSGDIAALRAARYVAEGMYQDPNYAQWANRSEAVVSGILAATVDSAAMTYNMWPALTNRIAGSYDWYAAPDYPGDQREGAYSVWEMALVALYHPDSATRATFRGYLLDHYNKQATKYKLPGSGYFGWSATNVDSGRVWQVANGSNEATVYSGPDIDSTYCGTPLVSGGTASATNGSKTLTGSGTSWSGSAGRYIILVGTKGGAVYMEANRIASAPSNTSITLYWPWQGDTGTLTKAHIHDAGFPVKAFERVSSAGTSRVPRQYETNDWYSCEVVSATKIQLDHAFSGDTSSGEVYRKISASNEYYTFFPAVHQPFMDGLRASAYALASEALDGHNQTESDGYKSLVKDLIDSLYDNRDPLTNGLVYYSYFPPCKGDPNTPDICNREVINCLDSAKRDYNMEGVFPFAWHYLQTLDATEKTRADQFYQWLYARPGYASPSASDGCYAAYPTTAIGLARDKALGQSFGHGGGSTWPAARLGGPAPAENRTLTVQVGSPLAYGDRIRITATNASGVAVTNTCQAVACSVTSDFRAGGQTVLIEYLNASSAVLARATQNVIVN